MECFGVLSGITMLLLLCYRFTWLRNSQIVQCLWAAAIWLIHILTFFLLCAILRINY